jgi:hypothetical protein
VLIGFISATICTASIRSGTLRVLLTVGAWLSAMDNSLMNGGDIYMSDAAAASLNINASTFTVGTVTESNSLSGFTPTWQDTCTEAAC